MRTVYRIVETEKQLNNLIKWVKETGVCSVDFETNGYPVYDDNFRPTILGVSFQIGSAWIIPLAHFDSPVNNWKKSFRKFCTEIITNPSILKIAWNLGFEYSIFLKYGYRMRGRIFDGMLAKYLLNEERPNDLKSQVAKFLPEFDGYDLPGAPSGKSKRETIIRFWSSVDLEELSQYCAGDCDFTLRLMVHFEKELIEEGLYPLFRSFYMPLIRILARTYLQGVRIDRDFLVHLEDKYQKLLSDLENKIRAIPLIRAYEKDRQEVLIQDYVSKIEEEISEGNLSDRQIDAREEKISRLLAGEPTTKNEAKLFEPLNFASPKQMIDLLYYSDMGFEFPIKERSDSGAPSTAEDTLEKLKSEDDTGFIEGLLELRGLSKMYSTYIKNILTDQLTEKDRLHPSFLLMGTITGRLSSRNPNFQNIPRVFSNPDIKKYILPDKPGQYIVETDASQAELRIAAALSGDAEMKKVFSEGKNIHAATAAKITGAEYDLINKARKDPEHPKHEWATREHKKAKVTNFGIFYGMSGYKLSDKLTQDTGVHHSVAEADELISDWFKAYRATQKFINDTRELAKEQGYIESPIGRRRRLPILLNPRNAFTDKGSYNEALRQSVNAPIQGWASDMTQWANINIYEAILKGELPSYLHLYITVHDSLEYSIYPEDIVWAVPKIQAIAGSVKNMKKYLGGDLGDVEMKFSAELGITWGHAHEFFPNKDYISYYNEQVKEWNKFRTDNNLKLFNDEEIT
jgi:DNA polymerase I